MDIELTIKKIIEQTGLSREEIKKRIDKQVQDLSGLIDEEGALTIIARELGIKLKENREASNIISDQKIKDLKPDTFASFIGRIVEIGQKREYSKKDGTKGQYFSFLLEDNTGIIRNMVWDQQSKILEDSSFALNEIIRVVNGSIKSSQKGEHEAHIGMKSQIQLKPDDVDFKQIPKNELKFLKINELSLKEPLVNLEAEIKAIYPPKEFTRKDGKIGKRASIQLQDNTGTIFITFWNNDIDKLKELSQGDKIQITRLTTKPGFQDKTKVDLTISPSSDLKILEKGKIENITTLSEKRSSIQELIDNKQNGMIECIVQEIENVRTVNVRGIEKKIQVVAIADESNAIKLNLWEEKIVPDLKINDILRIQGVYMKLNLYSNQIEANISSNGKIEIIKKKIETKHTIVLHEQKKEGQSKIINIPIDQINSEGYYEIKASIIKELDRIYMFQACSLCKRKSDNCSCTEPHTFNDRPILSVFIDDETAVIKTSFIGDIAEKILNDTAVNIKNIIASDKLTDYLKEKSKELIGRELLIKGKSKFSQYANNYEITAISFEFLDIKIESQKIIEDLENES